MNESTFRSSFTHKLRLLGWIVWEEKTLLKNGKKYRADIIAYHRKYRDLGWLVIEAKTSEHTKTITEGHRQITSQYINSTIQFNNEKPICFAILAPWIPAPITNEYVGPWKYILRLFTRYGIGVINNAQKCVIFCTETKEDVWSQLLLYPKYMRQNDYNNIPRPKKYLSKQVANL